MSQSVFRTAPDAASPSLDWIALDEFVAAFESAIHQDAERPTVASLADYLPPVDSPLRLPVLAELVRVDLERGWETGAPRALATYLGEFPELRESPALLRDMAFEEYRLRRAAGDAAAPQEYADQYSIDVASWPSNPAPATASFRTRRHEASRGGRLTHPLGRPIDGRDPRLPQVGDELAGFRLVDELGQGTFGRVYLAQQGELADRYVALKVTLGGTAEPNALARLQHTNIVPIHSIHRCGDLQVVCMPYLGSTTLADVLRDLAGRKTRPASGMALVETFKSRTSRGSDQSHGLRSHHPSTTTAPPPATRQVSLAAPMTDARAATLQMLERYTYVEAVLWLAARLAEGLAHAHERGILHRDIKPANVLITDDGQPLLLDFNLAADLRARANSDGPAMGGTLPYMAPEQLQAIGGHDAIVDTRGDLFALGVVMFEALAGRHPFPVRTGSDPQAIQAMLADRVAGAPPLRDFNRSVSPATAAIVARCLSAVPAERYASARALQEDLQRQLDHRPLRHAADRSPRERMRKWRRRHPRLSSASAAALAGALLMVAALAGIVVRERRLERYAAIERLDAFRAESRRIENRLISPHPTAGELQRTSDDYRNLLSVYRVLEDPNWRTAPDVQRLDAIERKALDVALADALFLWGAASERELASVPAEKRSPDAFELAIRLNDLAIGCFALDAAPRALLEQRASLEALRGASDAIVSSWKERASDASAETARDLFRLAIAAWHDQEYERCEGLLERAVELDPQDAAAWLMRGHVALVRGRAADAVPLYATGIALWPEGPWGYFYRGAARLELQQYARAEKDFDRMIELLPGEAVGRFNRGLARLGRRDAAGAIDEFDQAIALGLEGRRPYLARARAKEGAGDLAGAEQDRNHALAAAPVDADDHVAHGMALLRSQPPQPQAALTEFDAALALHPDHRAALQNKSHVLAEHMGKTAEGVATLDRVVERYPDYTPGWAGRGVLLARLGRFEEAHRDARQALAIDDSPATNYQVAGIYALASRSDEGSLQEALRLLARAFRRGFGLDLVDRDPELDPIRTHPSFAQLIRDARNVAP